MTSLYNKKKDKLINDLKDKEYREAFVASHISNGIALQIRSMRGELTQGKFGNLAHMKQEQISRLENPDNEMLSVKTLLKLAAARDVALVVRFIPFGDLVKWDLNLSSESLEVPSFSQDPYLLGKEGKEAILSDANQYVGITPTKASDNVIILKDHKFAKASSSNFGKIRPRAIAVGI
jgi:hypothetical protein